MNNPSETARSTNRTEPSDDLRSVASDVATIWLIGKSGAGKSSLIQKLTMSSSAELGTGVRPCTLRTARYDVPESSPLLRFLDTRGIGEAGFDADVELRTLSSLSHAVIIVVNLSDAMQQPVADILGALRKIERRSLNRKVCVIYTHSDEIDDDRTRLRLFRSSQEMISKAWGEEVAHCLVNLADPHDRTSPGSDSLDKLLQSFVPWAGAVFEETRFRQREKHAFDQIRDKIQGYATAAAASDTLPIAGLVAVPTIQGKMMHWVVGQCNMAWSQRLFAEFLAMLGGAFAMKYALHLGERQLIKAIPGWGQTVGTAVAATTTYASTFALGRSLFYYLFAKLHQREVDTHHLKAMYREALMNKGLNSSRRPSTSSV
ncbi:GTPase domain-containing protein [Congregibacter litoralis]|uniref:Uncharacterized protein/domain protein associated with GTPase n=1 Tax=Congregibacter litoralis KT71 TaxID=314285 RepID=A4A4W6_9GAMM|nr:GTPase domain-containing protein [Congregibacter litoralis]EAQ98837.2 Uncharacterized protein/domain protein associated with GTPase [Congregibacter litoralis KT71]